VRAESAWSSGADTTSVLIGNTAIVVGGLLLLACEQLLYGSWLKVCR
jgi:hypothetical protein